MSKKWMLLAVTMLVLASLACGIGGGGTTAPTEEEPPSGQPTEAPGTTGGEEEMPAISPDALSGLSSYRARLVWSWQTDTGETQEMRMEGEETRNPAAQHYTIQTADSTMEWIRIDDTQWTNFGSGWMQSQQDPEEMSSFGDLLGPDTFSDITSSSQSQFVGRETINGLRTRHYRLELSPAEIAALAQGEVTDVHSDVWVADGSGLPAFVVRYQMGWRGEMPSGEGATGTVEWTYDIYDVNASITITAPETAGGLPEDIPAYNGPTSDLFSMEGLVSFSTTDDVATVADFYRQELPAQGWTLSSDEDLSGMVMQSWAKAGRELQVMINSQEGTTSVMLSISTP